MSAVKFFITVPTVNGEFPMQAVNKGFLGNFQ